jgi:hypothetical protein
MCYAVVVTGIWRSKYLEYVSRIRNTTKNVQTINPLVTITFFLDSQYEKLKKRYLQA